MTASPPPNRRMQLIAGLVFAGLLAVVVVVLVAGRPKEQSSPAVDAARTHRLLDGIEQHGATLGDPAAPVTIVEFVDLQCPFCAAHQIDQQPVVIDRLVRTGKARITIEPLAFLGPDSNTGRNVFLRLAAKDHGWDFLNRAYLSQRPENSGYITKQWLRDATSGIPGVTDADLAPGRDAVVNPGIAQADALAKRLMGKKDGTPFFAVGPTGADPATYRKVDLAAKSSAAESIIAAANAVQSPR